jgi:hypothetical protein
MSTFSDDFLDGQIACREGKECPADASDAFERGYAVEYEMEQQQTELSIGRNK